MLFVVTVGLVMEVGDWIAVFGRFLVRSYGWLYLLGICYLVIVVLIFG